MLVLVISVSKQVRRAPGLFLYINNIMPYVHSFSQRRRYITSSEGQHAFLNGSPCMNSKKIVIWVPKVTLDRCSLTFAVENYDSAIQRIFLDRLIMLSCNACKWEPNDCLFCYHMEDQDIIKTIYHVQWNLSIATTQWSTSLPSGAHLGGQGPPRWAPEGRNC